jgi:carboxylesterase type B
MGSSNRLLWKVVHFGKASMVMLHPLNKHGSSARSSPKELALHPKTSELFQLQSSTQQGPATDPGITTYSPSIDDCVLTDNPSNVFRQGKQLKIPILAGINAKELLFASRALPTPNLTTFLPDAQLVFDSKTLDFLALYPADTLDGDLIHHEQNLGSHC